MSKLILIVLLALTVTFTSGTSAFAQADGKSPPVPRELTPAPPSEPPVQVTRDLTQEDFQFEQGDSKASYAPGGACNSCCIPRDYAPPLSYYATVDTLFWNRSVRGAPLFLNANTGQTLIDAKDNMKFNTNVAPSLKIGRIIDDCVSVEAGYFGFYGWQAHGETALNAINAPLAETPFPNLGLPLIAGMTEQYTYGSSLTSFELNVREKFTESFAVLYGFRYLNLCEKFRGTYNDQFGAFFGEYQTRTRNNLFGGQIGGEHTSWWSQFMSLTLHGNVGLYGNSADQTTNGSFLNPPFFGPDERTAFRGQLSFASQLGARAGIQLTERLAARIGYQAMWISGVALAPNQAVESDWIFLNGPAGISTRGGMFMHGALTGLEYVW